MKLTSKGRYAVTAVLDVALHAQDGPVPLMDISERQDISLSYLEQLFSRLRRKGLVSSVRGPGGGYHLGREMSDITISDIIVAIDENVDATRCSGVADCQGGTQCLTHSLWVDLSDRIYSFLDNITLADLVSKQEIRSVADRQNKCHAQSPRFQSESEFNIQVK
ncbi:Fe-S cluster assembly transcriptional regulator IscR [Aestuariibacter salexigens]|uniref:Fe-S cluster assembly transcriptional regulator IscR n=1 Tax=Aestuariibacter salexigens TaxID=226010 RepID=UPI000427F592|nr:Fe-S cluster assembly transcriptional regulator IscR [Aestuariibacter salexigens]